MRQKIAAILVIGLLGGCQSATQKPATQPTTDASMFAQSAPGSTKSQAKPGAPEEQLLMKRITLRRTGGFQQSKELTLTITPSGRYYAMIPGEVGTSIKEGELENNQMRAITAAFSGWSELRPNYMPQEPAPEDFRIDLKYGDKAVLASDAAELPPAFLRAYRELRTQIGF
jgi:hypothetical protein